MKGLQRTIKRDLDAMPVPRFDFTIRASHRTEVCLSEVTKMIRQAKKNRRVVTQQEVVDLYLSLLHPHGKQPRWVMVRSGDKYSWRFDNDAPIDPEDPRIVRNAKSWLRRTLGLALINGRIQP